MKYLGIDYGDRKIGLALSDEDAFVADKLVVIRNNERLFDELSGVIREHRVGEVVLGISYSSTGAETEQTKKILKFKEKIDKEFGMPVNLWDESYSSQRSEKGLTQKQKKKSDSIAAQIILQEFLDFKRTKI